MVKYPKNVNCKASAIRVDWWSELVNCNREVAVIYILYTLYKYSNSYCKI